MINSPVLAVRVLPGHRNHHLWNNNGTWFIHYTVHPDRLTKLRRRHSLATKDLTEARRNAVRLGALERVSEDDMVVFGPKTAPHTVTVFTDIDCGFCRRLHSEIGKYNANGIRIRYLFMPRTGKGSESYQKAVGVWCAKDRQQAMTDAKAGKDVPAQSCKNPVDSHMALADSMGLNGTPALILPDGELLPGYVPADRLKAVLEDQMTAAAR